MQQEVTQPKNAAELHNPLNHDGWKLFHPSMHRLDLLVLFHRHCLVHSRRHDENSAAVDMVVGDMIDVRNGENVDPNQSVEQKTAQGGGDQSNPIRGKDG